MEIISISSYKFDAYIDMSDTSYLENEALSWWQ